MQVFNRVFCDLNAESNSFREPIINVNRAVFRTQVQINEVKMKVNASDTHSFPSLSINQNSVDGLFFAMDPSRAIQLK